MERHRSKRNILQTLNGSVLRKHYISDGALIIAFFTQPVRRGFNAPQMLLIGLFKQYRHGVGGPSGTANSPLWR